MEHFRKYHNHLVLIISVICLILTGKCFSANHDTALGSSQVIDPLAANASEGNHSENEDHGNQRYKVASWNFAHVGPPFVVAATLLVACLAKIAFHFENHLSSVFPESCLLIILGVIFGVLLKISGVSGYQMDSNTFFLYLLPPIVLDAGYFMPNRAFFDNIGTILLFAVVGTLLNTLLIGVSIWLLAFTVEVQLLHCLTLSSLLSAVDPVAVLAVFEQVHINEILHIIVFGESLLNDAVTVVLYHMFESYSEIGSSNILAVDVVAGLASFLVVGVCGTLIGIIFGLLTGLMSRFTDHVRVIQPLLVFVMGYLSYLTAEIFHFSGILACTFCAITMKQYVEANISAKSHTTIKYFMKMLASVCETIIFMLLGISTVLDSHHWDTAFIVSTLVFCMIYRALGVVGLSYLANKLRLVPLTKKDQFIMSYGGLRGAIAFSMAILLNESIFKEKKLFVTTTVVVVYFTVFVQGTTIKPLVDLLDVKKSQKHKPSMNEQINTRMMDHFMAGIEDVIGQHGHHELRARFEYINSSYLKPVLIRRKEMTRRGLSILNVFQKLHEKDVREYVQRNGSVLFCSRPYMTNTTSLAGLLIHHSAPSISSDGYSEEDTAINEPPGIPLPMPGTNSSTCLDMQVLEAQNSRKMKDDSKVHHIIEDAMFMPRQRFTRHRRHMLPESENHPPFHHKARLHLRHLVSHNQPQTNGYIRTQTNGLDSSRPRKNVSFADTPYIDIDDDREAGSAIAEASMDSSDSDSDAGIVFTADQTDDGSVSEPVSPTAVEMLLPWKRNTGRDPVSCSLVHSLPTDDQPQLGEVPSWVNNEDYTSPAVASEEIMERQQSRASVTSGAINPTSETVIEAESLQQQEETPTPYEGLPLPWEAPPCSWNPPVMDNNVLVPVHNDIDNSYGDENGNTAALPPPWHCSPDTTDNSPSKEAPHVPQVSGDYTNPSLPWLCNIGQDTEPEVSCRAKVVPSNPSKSCPVFHTGNRPAAAEEDFTECIPPPPWRSNSNIDVSLDQQAPRPAGSIQCPRQEKKNNDHGIPPLPWRTNNGSADDITDPMCSPSLSHDMDVFSLRPQPSSHSFRFSEAESKHSEHMHKHHHMIDIQHHSNHNLEIDEEVILDLDTEEVDLQDRVEKWLEASEAFLFVCDEQEPFLSSCVDTQDGAVALLDCESAVESTA